ncbi:ABC transporter ATP-binding protein [Caproiciproducens sp. NJN-50]|uniref:ABC transporter ATP-binding protein n=1 Tax=Acutalibacteraceae TaxID=3082771 RepID=UPI000FFE1BF7|nr:MULTISPECIES: ABC transporter ATP-binding protein [Acutalibacteraceae]QAT50396.1 ABC transporter ATP-binding protein [Caproiciproducens sp. NJN-50]
MAQIELQNITKNYGEKTALDDISLCVKDNEFFVLFGPAGAGKTTLLKTIAGIEFPQKGLVKINDNIVNHVEPLNRNVSMVFENYALYPQKTVYDNIASPMRSKLYRESEEHIRQAVNRVAKMMSIEHLLERRPSELSNGQRQRVAIGRCLVRKPNVFLMDEPLAHLDAKLRHFMRSELKEMQSAFNTTTLYVTHDYMEAMSLADRVAVLNNGRFEQIGTSNEMFYLPSNEFVAKLFGEPEINIFPAELNTNGDALELRAFEGNVTVVPCGDVVPQLKKSAQKIDIGVRGNDIRFSFQQEGRDWVRGSVYANEPIGNKVVMTVDIFGTRFHLVAPNHTKAELDQEVYIKFDEKNLIFFDSETQKFITRSAMNRFLAKS